MRNALALRKCREIGLLKDAQGMLGTILIELGNRCSIRLSYGTNCGACIPPSAGPRTSARSSLLRGDMIGADHVAPQFDLALEQSLCGLGALLVLRVQIHAAIAEGLAQFCIGERYAERTIELVDNRPRRRCRGEQHVPEIDVRFWI